MSWDWYIGRPQRSEVGFSHSLTLNWISVNKLRLQLIDSRLIKIDNFLVFPHSGRRLSFLFVQSISLPYESNNVSGYPWCIGVAVRYDSGHVVYIPP